MFVIHIFDDNRYIRLRNSQVEILENNKCLLKRPVEDVSCVIIANRKIVLTACIISEFSKNNIPLLLCNDKFMPISLTLPYYGPYNTFSFDAQLHTTKNTKENIWKYIIQNKIKNQAIALKRTGNNYKDLINMSNNVKKGDSTFLESRAAKLYWKRIFGVIKKETARISGTKKGFNGMLDYGYAVIRAFVLRSIAAHGLIAYFSVKHSNRFNTYALADDLMEPLRPFIDLELYKKSVFGNIDQQQWAKYASSVLLKKVMINNKRMSLINAFTVYIQSFVNAIKEKKPKKLVCPNFIYE